MTDSTDVRQTIERFLAGSLQPALSEPGEELIRISGDNFALEDVRGSLRLQAWSSRRNLVRRVTAINREKRGMLVLGVECFGKRPGTVSLIDLGRPHGQNAAEHSERLEFREQFHRFLRRQFPLHRVAELTTEADLEHSLSPAYPRALLRQGSHCWAAIGASPDPFHADRALSFGLIWLDYLRGRESNCIIQGLVLYLPAGEEKQTCLRLRFLDPHTARYMAFVYDEQGGETQLDLRDFGNLDTHLQQCRRAIPGVLDSLTGRFAGSQDVESIETADGERSWRVHGLEFARTCGSQLLFGIHSKRRCEHWNIAEAVSLAENLARLRCADAGDPQHPLYLAHPEAWLESQVRSHIEELDAQLLPDPIYGQVPAFAAAERGVLDLLAMDRGGRLAVLELKATADIHLPLQALDYWMRVKWHVDRREFSPRGYFPDCQLSQEPPRLLLVSSALDFHPANERILRFFSPNLPIERVGVGLQWRRELKVMFRSQPPC